MSNPKNTSESIRQRIRAKKLNESAKIGDVVGYHFDSKDKNAGIISKATVLAMLPNGNLWVTSDGDTEFELEPGDIQPITEASTDTATGTVDKVLAHLKGEGDGKIDGVLVDSSTANLISDIYSKLTDSDLKLKCQSMTYPQLANVCWKLASKNGVSWKSEGITEGKALVPGQLYVCENTLGKSLGKYLNPKTTILGTYHMFESLSSPLPLVFMESELPAQVMPLVVESANFDEIAKVFEDSGKFKYTFPVNQKDWDAWKEKQKENYTFSKLDGVDAVYNDGDHIMSFNPNKKEVYADIPKFLDKEGKLNESANGPTTMSTDGIIGMFMPSTPRWNILNDENTTSAQLVSATGSNYEVTRTGFGDSATYTITPATSTNEAGKYSRMTWNELCKEQGIDDATAEKISDLAHNAEDEKYSEEEFAKEVATMVTNKAKLKEVINFWLSGCEDFNDIAKAVGINEDKYDDITDQLVEGVQFEDVEGATYTVVSRSGDNITFRSDKDDDHNIWNGEKTTNINGPNSTSLFYKILSNPANEAMVIVDDKGTKGFEDQSELEAYLDKKYGSNGCARTPEDKDTIYVRTSDWKEVARWKGDDDYGVLSESVTEGDEPEDTEAMQKELNDLMMSTAGKSNESDEEDEDELHQDPMSVAQIIAFHKKKTGKDLTRASLPDGKALAKFIYDNFREIMHKTDYDDELAANRMADILSFFHMDETEFMRAWNKLIK